MHSCCTSGTLYKGLLLLVFAVIVIEYLFGSIIETKPWDTYTFNNTTWVHDFFVNFEIFTKFYFRFRMPTVLRHKNTHGPLLRKLVGKINETNSNPTHNSSQVNDIHTFFNLNSSNEVEDDHVKPNSTSFPLCPDIPPNLSMLYWIF